MLQVKELTLVHKKDLRTLVEDMSFVLNPGDKAVLIGEEGNGKSSVLKWMYNPALVEGYCQWSGSLAGNSGPVGYLAQELTSREKEMTVYDFCAAAPAFFSRTPGELGQIARQLRWDVGEYYSDRPVGTLSGGEQIKLQLSRLLFAEPAVLLLDEPSSDVDLDTLRWLETFINGYKGIILYISHDETLIEATANLILHLEHPREGQKPRCTVHRSRYGDYASRREAALAYQERQAKKEREEHAKKMERYRRIQQSVEHAQGAVSRQDPGTGRLLKKKMHTVLSMGRRFEREAADMTELPQVEEAVFLRFSPDISLPAGKTVLDLRLAELRQIAGELLSRRDLRAAYMSQDYGDTLPLERTAVEYLAPAGDRESVTRARTFLGSVRFAREEMFHPIGELSGGQKAKLLLTRMMLDEADVLILDEPTRNFSPLSGPRVRAVLGAYGGTIIAVSHDRKFLMEVCDKLYTLTENGLLPTDRDALL